MGKIVRKCSKCGDLYTEEPALSRKDNKTEICAYCGMREAIDAWREKQSLGN